MKNYFILATVTLGGMYFTNWSLEYLNYTTRIVFKSSKVLPTMMFGTLLQKKRYFFFEYMGGTLLVMGIVLFSMGDHEGMPNFNPVGLALITVGVCCDTVTSNLEEKVFFRRENPISQAEILCFSSMIGSAYLTIILVATGELKDGYQHAIEHVEVIPLIVASSVLGYVSVSLILLLINHYGATNAEIVKSSRKILQVLASFIVFPKTPNYKYAVGAVSVILGIMLLGHYQVKNPTEVYNSKQAQEKEKQGAAERQHYKPEADIL